jgi:C4-dicarboxylate-specific signal transduction histidine kinase
MGGISNTGLYWVHIFPLAAFFLKGKRVGFIWISVLFLMMSTILLLHLLHILTLPYDTEMLSILLVSYTFTTLFVHHYEDARSSYQIQTNQLTKELESFNHELQSKVAQEIKKSAQKDTLLILQSKMAGMGEMLGHISHQWKQPLATLSVIQSNMAMNASVNREINSDLRQDIHNIHFQIGYMSTTMRDFLNYYKTDNAIHTFLVKTIISQIKNYLNTSLMQHHIDLIFEYNNNEQILGYENALMQVLITLISNAKEAHILYKSPNPFIQVTFLSNSSTYVITVDDNAGGIDTAIKSLIFDAHFTTKVHGNGLGLYMAKEIINDKMKGEIEVHNIPQGSRFTIVLPKISL